MIDIIIPSLGRHDKLPQLVGNIHDATETHHRIYLVLERDDIPSIRAVEKLAVRKHGLAYYVDIHVQADPGMSLHDAHVVSGRVKGAIRDAVPAVAGTLVHMEPFEDAAGAPARDAQSSSRKTS